MYISLSEINEPFVFGNLDVTFSWIAIEMRCDVEKNGFEKKIDVKKCLDFSSSAE